MTTLMALKDGSTTTIVESYRIVDDVMVITGKDYVINGKYSIEGKQMIFVALKFERYWRKLKNKYRRTLG